MRIFKKIRIGVLLTILIILVAGVAIIDFGPALSKQPGIDTFFKGSFYMTPDEIIALHDKESLKASRSFLYSYALEYEQNINGYMTTVNYYFIKHGLIFKKDRLFNVSCSFATTELSIFECQQMAENLMLLLTPHFKPNEYDYHGHVRTYDNNEFIWIFNGNFLNKKQSIDVSCYKTSSFNKLWITFSKNSKLLNILSDNMIQENHEVALEIIERHRTDYGEFDYDQWREYSEEQS